MAKTIPQLTDATTVNAADELVIQQGGITKRATVSEMLNDSAIITATGSTTARSLAGRAADFVNVKDFGAVGDNVADDSAAIQAAVNTNRPVFFPQGAYRTNTAITTPSNSQFRAFSAGASFTGSAPLDIYPPFGQGVVKAYARGFANSILGLAHNDLPSSTLAFPTGVTGYGRNDNAGNTAFGIYAEARQYANTGVVTNEIDSFNHAAAPSANLPPDRSIGTTQQHPIALTIGAGGTANSSIGIHIAKEGSSPQQFLTGIYFSPDSCQSYGLLIDATSGSTHESAVFKHSVNRVGVRVIGSGTPVAANAWFVYTDGAGVDRFSIKQNGRLSFSTLISQATVGVAGAATPPPSNPTGYISIEVGGLTKVIPYYEP